MKESEIDNTVVNSVLKEIMTMLNARRELNGGSVNLLDVIDESKYTLAITDLLTKQNIKNITGIEMNEVPQDTVNLYAMAVKMLLKMLSSGKTVDNEVNTVINGYKEIINRENPAELINDHYNKLFPNTIKKYI